MFIVKDGVFTNRPINFDDGCKVSFENQEAQVPDHHIDYFRESIDYVIVAQDSVDKEPEVLNNEKDDKTMV